MGKTIELNGFPASVSVSDVKVFVERYTGEGTVYACKLRKGKGRRNRRAFAIIQFTTTEDAASIISLVNNRLYYGTFYLKVRELEKDIVPNPRSFLHSFEKARLYFGCQLSKEKFSILWNAVDVKVNFGIGMRKLYFFLSHNLVEYKLELSSENIWQIEMIQPRGGTASYLLFQLLGAPRIFKKCAPISISVYENPFFNFFKEIPDDQWFRATDFTPFCCIGQSSGLCLELPRGKKCPNFKENFPFYTESDRQYTLQYGSSFSRSLDLVPIVAPPSGNEIPYDILFKVNSLVQHCCLAGLALDLNFYKLVDPARISRLFIENALEKMYHSKEFCYEPSRWLTEQYKKYKNYPKSKQPRKSPVIPLDAGLVYVRRVQITPCKLYFCGPEINVSNRVLRHFHEYIDNFLRVSFVDEELDKMYSTDLSPRTSSTLEDGKTEIYKRILSVLRDGIVIGDKKFEFLAFSSSQLRENSLWMFAPTWSGLTAAHIREWMGDFRRIRNVAKYAARLGQSLSSSKETLSVPLHETEMIPDVEVTRNGTRYVFSDGIGKISAEFARKVAVKCGYRSFPSLFQIRYGGYKGVVAVDPTSSVKLSLRKSMLKYESDNTKLDVLEYSKYRSCYLNRQIITLLSTLGVKDHVFEQKQTKVIDQLNTILTDSLKAQKALNMMSAGETTDILKEMLKCGYKPDAEPFLKMMLQTFRASKLLELRLKGRIFIPKGRALMGCLDETRSLEYGQVFVQLSNNKRMRQTFDDSVALVPARSYRVWGKVVVAKNPCLHPGDVRVLRAVNVPALHHMVDCVVFPQKGHRPHPNECSGSDLDGDIYFVSWDEELIPPKQEEPMDYTPAGTMELDHDVTTEEVEEYFANYIVNDSLGIIANAHSVFADQDSLNAMAQPCLELAKIFSIAVDFPKTGVPAIIPSHLHPKEYPDFMEKPDKPSYESCKVIGKLFREVKDIAPDSCARESFTLEVAHQSYDRDMEVDGFMDYVDDAYYHKSNYDYKLGNLMDYYGITTEAEILSGYIVRMSKSFIKRRDAEAIIMAVRSLRKEARKWFNGGGNNADSDDDDDVYARASAWYHVTYHPSYWGCYNEGMNRPHFLSFAWCVYDKLVQIKKEKASFGSAIYMSSLKRRFNSGLYI